ncbi:hypothetical protein CEE37_04090 [candidate division LCP-89 bacterium B3_LCP]|uniref:Big-1 domain-containing protein n=1 Tax=candidate division LCP-89 bacterium B3_LCP TaxID=2012998 RepID=A0A532V439_UNCL8|nr:MAG: hypothetical protein CEE37_04090 [candidate division LCP-89 bacterium B3_LCP]
MKRLRSLFAILTLIALAMTMTSCSEKTSTGPGAAGSTTAIIGSVTVVANDPQLVSISGETVSTKIYATVTDTAGSAVPGVVITFTTPDFGSVSSPQDSTDEFGQVEVTFSSTGNIGQATITASVSSGGNTISGSTQIDVQTLAGLPHDITLSLYPPNLYIAPSFEDSVKVTVRVMDSLNVGIPGLYVSLSTSLGVISLADTTGPNGTVVSYVNPNGEFGAGIVTASVNTTLEPDTGSATASLPEGPITWPGLNTGEILVSGLGFPKGSDPENRQIYETYTLSASDTFYVTPAESNGLLLMYSDTNVIFADNGITKANITALLKDAENQVIRDVEITFTSDYGTINSPVLTDSTGQAHAIFQDIGYASVPDSAKITAKYPALNIADSIYVIIEEARNIDHIVLNSATQSMIANGFDSTRVDATVYLEGNSLAPPGTEVYFTLGGDNIGGFSAPIAYVGDAGTATVYYEVGVSTGVDTLNAMVDGMFADPPLVMSLISGPPSSVSIAVDTSFIMVSSPEMIEVSATVRDTTGNLVGNGVAVLFSTDLGSISPPEAPTISGVATSFFAAATNAGAATIVAKVGVADSATTLITILPSTPNTVGLSAQYTTIQVAQTGGTYQTEIFAHVYDAAGNLVLNNIQVHFLIEDEGFPFGGVNLNNHGLEDSSMTSGGIATVSLNAGFNSGPVTIRAWTYDNEENLIEAVSSLVTIVSGPPASLSVAVNSSEPVQMGGDAWGCEVSALVMDTHGNEVANGTAVHFYLSVDTSNVEIWGDAITYNQLEDPLTGGPIEGVAFTALLYQSEATFTEIWIYAYTMVDGDSIIDGVEYQLPLADGVLNMAVIPESWNYGFNPPGEWATQECRAYLVDGYNHPINGAVIIFQTTRGSFYWDEFGYYPSNEKITGPQAFPGEPDNDSTGQANMWMRTHFNEAFPDPSAVEATAQVYTQVNNYFDITSPPVTVTFINSPPPPPAGGD